ncbi:MULTISPECIES: S24 family peptidase [Enterobacter]|uniref:HumD family translesion DNA polymerase n=1 Tax=Enterobacter TaxID=547 RepID=UPI000267FA58|nr:DNA repair protein [Enterobacter cloacae subsp. dissolvens SDM]
MMKAKVRIHTSFAKYLDAANWVHGNGKRAPLCCSILTGGFEMGFPSPATDYIEERISLDKLFISHPSASYFMKSANTCWHAGITQGALLIVDCSATPCDGSVVVCKLAGDFHIRRFRTHPYKHLKSLGDDGRKERINTDDDGIFGVLMHAVNDMRTMEFDDNPVI